MEIQPAVTGGLIRQVCVGASKYLQVLQDGGGAASGAGVLTQGMRVPRAMPPRLNRRPGMRGGRTVGAVGAGIRVGIAVGRGAVGRRIAIMNLRYRCDRQWRWRYAVRPSQPSAR